LFLGAGVFFVCNSALSLEISSIDENNGLSLEKNYRSHLLSLLFPIARIVQEAFHH
jgi:hypothetical protein